MAEMNRNNAVKIDSGFSLDECIDLLLDYQKRGESVYLEFNGYPLYSCDITVDNAYKEVTGYETKDEFEKALAAMEEKFEKEENAKIEQAKANIPNWIKEGSEMIYPERKEDWERCVKSCANGLYHGSELDSALELMKALDSNVPMDKIKEQFEAQSHSGASEGLVKRIIFTFSKRGPEFYEATAEHELTDREKQIIENKKRENAELEELHKNDNVKGGSATRRNDEQEIAAASAEKQKLTAEIKSLEQRLAVLKTRAAQLDNKNHDNGLEDR